jgi:transposase
VSPQSLLRRDSRSSGPANWGPAPRRWLAEVVCPTPAQPSGCQASSRAVTARPEHVHAWRFHAVVEALQALRGVPCTVAVTLGAALGALPRLDIPRALMQFLGLLPAADASGARRQPGVRTSAGHTQARRALGAGAWASRSPAKVSRHGP